MSRQTGPRRLVLNDLKNPPQLRGPVSGGVSGTLKTHSASKPKLSEGSTYLISASQDINYLDSKGVQGQKPQSCSRKFQVQGSKIALDPSLVHSVYPPASHTEYWNVLPHVLFNNSMVPWMINYQSNDKLQPWFGLLVFTHDELILSPEDLDTLKTAAKDDTVTQNPTLSVPMTYTSLQACTGYNDINTSLRGSAKTQAIFLKNDLYTAIFKDRSFKAMSHVRSIDSTGMAGILDDTGTYAVTISPRPGPRNISAPQAVYAHLVALPNDTGSSSKYPFTGLISLYSWSYTCLPSSSFATKTVMANLGRSVQPFRVSDTNISAGPSNVEWVKSRMRAGYTLARYRPQSGEQTMSMHRGPLIPTNPYAIGDPSIRDMPPSKFGSDLAILDREVGVLDLTFQLAWELGRTLAMSDRTFSAAVMRVKNFSHSQALTDTKAQVDKANPSQKSFKPINDAVGSMPDLSSKLKAIAKPQTYSIDQRWARTATSSGARSQYTFVNDAMKAQYGLRIDPAAKQLSLASPLTSGSNGGNLQGASKSKYNESNSPDSIDFANVYRWVLDKWYLSNIPILHMIPDPLFIPKESIRSFYIDPTWMKCFVDGALSITEHFTMGDDVRESIKARLQECINASVDNKTARVPKWGFFLRSELVLKFPNLRISAPKNDPDGTTDVLRWDIIDDDLMLALFDRVPGTGAFRQGITIEPPGHQLSFSLGSVTDWTKDSKAEYLITKLKDCKDDAGKTYDPGMLKYISTGSNQGFDFVNNIINPKPFTDDIKAGTSISVGNEPAFVGVQLVATHPSLTLDDQGSGFQAPKALPNSLTTTAKSKTALQPPAGAFPYQTTLKASATVQNIVQVPTLGRPQGQVLSMTSNGSIQNPQFVGYDFNTNYIQPDYPSPTANIGSSSGARTDIAPFFNTSTFNVRYGDYCSTLFAFLQRDAYPQPPSPFPQDIQVRSVVRKQNPRNEEDPPVVTTGYRLSSIRYAFKVGPSTKDQKNWNIFNIIPPTSTGAGGTPDAPPAAKGAEDFKHRASISERVQRAIPTVRNECRGKRWILKTKYPDPDAENMFTVTAIPNRGDMTAGKYAWDLSPNTEIRFTIEGVAVNFMQTE